MAGVTPSAEETRCESAQDHDAIGGLTASVAEAVGRAGVTARLGSVTLPDEDLAVGVPAELYQHYGLTVPAVAAKARARLE
ncbi:MULTISPECIES: hypothetical protein [unclassified Geodermatophilus]|uniref:hypothetical protein n=1 Tax=unclassified Geodermatophilus TaxID=2637632 RepID=UPI003EE8F77C